MSSNDLREYLLAGNEHPSRYLCVFARFASVSACVSVSVSVIVCARARLGYMMYDPGYFPSASARSRLSQPSPTSGGSASKTFYPTSIPLRYPSQLPVRQICVRFLAAEWRATVRRVSDSGVNPY